MSDFYIRLMRTDLHWQPTLGAAAAAAAYVAELFNGPGDDVEDVEYEFYDRVTLIDAGENTERITCPLCAGDIDMEWFYDLIETNGESFDSLDVVVPCCRETVRLDGLRYEWPLRQVRGQRYERDTSKVPARRTGARRRSRTSRPPGHSDPCPLLIKT